MGLQTLAAVLCFNLKDVVLPVGQLGYRVVTATGEFCDEKGIWFSRMQWRGCLRYHHSGACDVHRAMFFLTSGQLRKSTTQI